jgi:hypothetical protein
MSKADTEIKELIGSVDLKLDLLAKDVSIVRDEILTINSAIKGLDNRLWAFGGLILAACLGAFLKALNL